MPEFRSDELLIERMFGAASDRNVAAVGEAHELQGVLESLLGDDVARNYGERFDLEFGRIQGKQIASASSVPGSVSIMTRRGSRLRERKGGQLGNKQEEDKARMAKARGIRTVIRESSGKVGCSGNDAREYTCERARKS